MGASGESASSGRDEPLAGAMARSASVTDRKRKSQQKSRSSVKNATGGASEEFVESDESFRSALSDFDPDCSSETAVLQEMLDRDKEEGEGSSGSHDSRRSDSQGKQQTSASSSSGGSGSRGVEPLGALPGFTGRIRSVYVATLCSPMCACQDMSGYIGICLVMLGLCREYTGICLDMLGNPGIRQDM